MSLDERVAQVERASGGFNVLARQQGDTIVQAFVGATVHVYVVVVGPPAPRPASPPPPPDIRAHGPVTSWWGDNHYQVRANYASSMPGYFEHLLSLRGRVGQGEYVGRLAYLSGAGYDQLATVGAGWANDRRDLSFDVGDTAGRLFGPLGDAMPIRGLRAARARDFDSGKTQLTQEIFAGEVRGAGDPNATKLTQPAVGASLSGSHAPSSIKDLKLSFGTSLAAYATEASPYLPEPGQTGILAGLFGRADARHGLAVELRSSLSAAEPNGGGGSTSAAGAVAASFSHQSQAGSERLDYHVNQRGFRTPLYSLAYPGQQRFSASVSRRVRGVVGSAAAAYGWTEKLGGGTAPGTSYSLALSVPLWTAATLTLGGSANESATPTPFRADGVYVWSQQRADAKLEYRMAGGALSLQSDLSHAVTEADQRTLSSSQAAVSLQRRRTQGDRWDGGGRIGVTRTQHRLGPEMLSTLAVDQPAPTLAVHASGNARFLQGPLEASGGIGVQATAMPAYQIAPYLNLGVQFTPTAAHQLAVTLNASRWLNSSQWSHYVTARYVYHFGNSVKAPPIFEFMSYGTVEGRICYDEDHDGVCSPDEPPLPKVPVVLSNGARTVTDERGRYRFERLKPGFYHLEAVESVVREYGRPSTVLLASFELPIRGSEDRDFGVMRSCRIQGHVINDLDMNGKIDDGEPLFAGPLVAASGAAGDFQARVGHAGTFSLMVPCGDYRVSVDSSSLPAMHQLVTDEDVEVSATLADTPTIKMMVNAVRTIAGDVFVDGNRNGRKDPGEPIVAGATVRAGAVSGPTDESGAFLLRRLPAGEHRLVVDERTLPAGLQAGAAVVWSLSRGAEAIEDVHLPVVPGQ